VDLHIFGADTQHITAGVPVTVTRMTDGVSQSTTLERVLPGTATASQSTVARATVDNADGLPGLANDHLQLGGAAPLALPLDAYEERLRMAREAVRSDSKRVAQVVKGWVAND